MHAVATQRKWLWSLFCKFNNYKKHLHCFAGAFLLLFVRLSARTRNFFVKKRNIAEKFQHFYCAAQPFALFCRFEGVDALRSDIYVFSLMCTHTINTNRFQTSMFVRKRLACSVKVLRQALSSKLFCVMLSAVFVRVFVTLLRVKRHEKIVRLSCVKQGKTL